MRGRETDPVRTVDGRSPGAGEPPGRRPVHDQQQPGGRRPEEGADMVSTPRSESGSGGRLSSIRPVQVLAGAVGVIAIVFIVQNRHRVHIDFFAVNLSAPVWLVLTVMVLVGVLIGYLLGRRR
jgi:putative membrane protein